MLCMSEPLSDQMTARTAIPVLLFKNCCSDLSGPLDIERLDSSLSRIRVAWLSACISCDWSLLCRGSNIPARASSRTTSTSSTANRIRANQFDRAYQCHMHGRESVCSFGVVRLSTGASPTRESIAGMSSVGSVALSDGSVRVSSQVTSRAHYLNRPSFRPSACDLCSGPATTTPPASQHSGPG